MSDTSDKTPSAKSSSSDVEAFLEQVARVPVRAPEPGVQGRMLFAMDATASREGAWRQALRIQSDMFLAAKDLGGLRVQLAFYRGYGTFKVSPWIDDSDQLVRLMASVSCQAGPTQLSKILKHCINETKQSIVNALVFVGDCFEEDIDRVAATAGELGLLGVPVFIFQEGENGQARSAFMQVARLSGGVYARFDAKSPNMLRELLKAVAVYAAGGRPALERAARKKGGEEALRLVRLLPKQ
ncbi:hypothetical protein EDD55_10867 [Varunaivibrio sulfuroxidans]|uniref:VWA domain-containing protein n=2 Tax=Varunaivibrio sulfuroxidans TaxID=1773489 RepID=A0A4R3J601_9PROT|nr:VWA domain-containing protein [Varunaivibrio sulfuroxidans]TCS61268.1 hypothetical protein EDD55_10867 [Varunaivibrio sulfuroxidans]